jgi:hypothetical protein
MDLCGAILRETEAPEAGQVLGLAISLLVVGVAKGGLNPHGHKGTGPSTETRSEQRVSPGVSEGRFVTGPARPSGAHGVQRRRLRDRTGKCLGKRTSRCSAGPNSDDRDDYGREN